jgi:anhydro-N-acetylmuramic acid kinase
MTACEERYIGLMSGTSCDSIDAVLVTFEGGTPSSLHTHSHPIPADLKQKILDLSQPGNNEIDRMGQLDHELGKSFADAALTLIESSGLCKDLITAIGSHGQTIRHRPPAPGNPQPFTLQIADPNLIAELTGITTVADFRRRDMAAGGHGAPLAPAYHEALFGSELKTRAIVNVGGMGNVTLLRPNEDVLGFDTGPGNVLLDGWIQRQKNLSYDSGGAWASEGKCHTELLAKMMSHPFFEAPAPKSTGREDFNLQWLDEVLLGVNPQVNAVDVQATLLELSVRSICESLPKGVLIDELFVCGGGAHNLTLMKRIAEQLPETMVCTTEALGLSPDWVEGVAFAWLAKRTLQRLSGNLPAVTGAARQTILGGVYFTD